MRRKSDRTRSVDVASPAHSTRRSSRRARKSPSKSPDPTTSEDKVRESDVDNHEKGRRDSSTDHDSEEHSIVAKGRRKILRTMTKEKGSPSKRSRRGAKSEEISVIAEEENGSKENEDENAVENDKDCENDVPFEKPLDDLKEQNTEQENDSRHSDKENTESESQVEIENQVEHEDKKSDSEQNGSADNAELNEKERMEDEVEKSETSLQVEKKENNLQSEENDKPISNTSENECKPEAAKESQQSPDDKDKNRLKIESSEKQRRSGSKTRERRSRFDEKPKSHEEKENEKKDDSSKSKGLDTISSSAQKTDKPSKQTTKKRRWLSRKSSESKPQVLAISTDSLKNLISDVHPVPLSDIRLESSSEPEEVAIVEKEEEKPRKREKSRNHDKERDRDLKKSEEKTLNRKVTVIKDREKSLDHPPSPPRNEYSSILYITNLVRPFTVLQLKGLLARTGKIVENGFWIDRIKSKCYVKYETEDQAIETRHALHGVRWPTSNPKCLNVDFGSEIGMEKAIASTLDEGPKFGVDSSRDNRIVGTGWDKERFDFDENKDFQVSRPVREWDVGKKEDFENETERNPDRERVRERERDRENDRERRRYSNDRDSRDHRRSASASPARKFKKKDNEPPLRLLDDLFRKTKITPCIYWLPLTPEQISEKEEARRKRMEEHEEIRKQRELEREKERERERERDKEREKERERRRERERSNDRRRSRSRDRRRY